MKRAATRPSLPFLLVLACAPVGAATTPEAYVACPQGLFQCGEMLHPPKSLDYKVPVICDAGTLQGYINQANSLKGKINRAVGDLRSVANTLEGLGGLYADYDPKKDYLNETARAVRDGLLAQFMVPLNDDLNHASQCMPEPQWYHADIGCWKIGASCFNRSLIEWKMRRLDPLLMELQNDLIRNNAMLRDGLPTYLSDGHGGNRCASVSLMGHASPTPAPCRSHMTAALDALNSAMIQIRANSRP